MSSLKTLFVLFSVLFVLTKAEVPQEETYNHIFLVKTDLSREEVESLLRKAEKNKGVEPQTATEEVENQQEIHSPNHLNPNHETVLARKNKGEKNLQKEEKGNQKIQDAQNHRAEKNMKNEEKQIQAELHQMEKQNKADRKASYDEAKANEKTHKAADKEAKKGKTEEPAEQENEAAPAENGDEGMDMELTEEDVSLTALPRKGGKGKANRHQNGQKQNQQNTTPEETPASQSQTTVTPVSNTMLLRSKETHKVGVSSYVALIMILFTFITLIILGTQYESLKKHFKLDMNNEALTDYLLVDEKQELSPRFNDNSKVTEFY